RQVFGRAYLPVVAGDFLARADISRRDHKVTDEVGVRRLRMVGEPVVVTAEYVRVAATAIRGVVPDLLLNGVRQLAHLRPAQHNVKVRLKLPDHRSLGDVLLSNQAKAMDST